MGTAQQRWPPNGHLLDVKTNLLKRRTRRRRQQTTKNGERIDDNKTKPNGHKRNSKRRPEKQLPKPPRNFESKCVNKNEHWPMPIRFYLHSMLTSRNITTPSAPKC